MWNACFTYVHKKYRLIVFSSWHKVFLKDVQSTFFIKRSENKVWVWVSTDKDKDKPAEKKGTYKR
jgi:hypothetical protein